MKKLGSFFSAFLPALLAFAMQYLATFFSLGASLFAGLLFSASGNSFSPERLGDFWMTTEFNTYVMIVYAIMTIAIFGTWYYARCGGIVPQGGRHPRAGLRPLSLLGIALLVPGMQYLSDYIVFAVASLFPSWMQTYEELLDVAGLSGQPTLPTLVYALLLAPVSEELAFRGVTLQTARRALPFWAANALQAALFGLFHMNAIQAVYAFFLGIVLGYVRKKGGSIAPSILLHSLFNAWGVIVSPYLAMGSSPFALFFWLAFAIILTASGLIAYSAGTRDRAGSGE